MSWSKTFTGDTRRRQVVALQRSLGCSRALAVGWDAMVRDLATEHDGDLTGWADEDLEAAVGWDGAAGELGAALRTSGVLVKGDGVVRPDRWAEREGSVHERDRKRSWRSSRRGRDGDGTVPGPSRDTDGTVPGLSPPTSPPPLAPSLSPPTPLSDSPPLSIPPSTSASPAEPSRKTGEFPREPDPSSAPAALGKVFVQAWTASVAGHGLAKDMLVLDSLTRARLTDSGLDAKGIQGLLERVGQSRFLTGQTPHRFVLRPRWVIENAARILGGEYDNDTRQIRQDLLGPWLAGWRRVDSTAEASTERTRARDLALSSLLEAWSGTEATRSWVTERSAEGAARELAARRATGKTTATLDELARKASLCEEVMRAGEGRMRPVRAAAPPLAIESLAAPQVTPAEILAGLRAKQKLIGLRPAEAERLAALEGELKVSARDERMSA